MPANPVNWFEIYVHDMARAGRRGRVMKPKTSIGQFGFIALVFDTEGNLFGLHSMR